MRTATVFILGAALGFILAWELRPTPPRPAPEVVYVEVPAEREVVPEPTPPRPSTPSASGGGGVLSPPHEAVAERRTPPPAAEALPDLPPKAQKIHDAMLKHVPPETAAEVIQAWLASTATTGVEEAPSLDKRVQVQLAAGAHLAALRTLAAPPPPDPDNPYWRANWSVQNPLAALWPYLEP